MNIAVMGAGNGGQAMAAYLALKGSKVNLYNRSPLRIEAVKENEGIYLSGVYNGFAKLNKVTTNLEKAVEDTEIIMIVTPAVAHSSLARELAWYLKDGQKIVLNPGRTGGALEFYNTLKKYHCKADVQVLETQTFIFASRVIGPAQARIYGIKEGVAIASFPGYQINLIIGKLKKIFPQFFPVPNVLRTGLNNIGAIFHPAPTLLNMAWIESTSGNFHYYHDGISPSVCKVISKMDYERMEVAYAFGFEPISAEDWLRLSYNAHGKNLYELLQNNGQYQRISAPNSVSHRYILEDVPMSLVPIASLGKMCNVNTPTIDMIINLANLVYGRDFRFEGRTVESLGITGLTRRELLSLVNNGYTDKVRAYPGQNRNIVNRFEKLIYKNYMRYQEEVE